MTEAANALRAIVSLLAGLVMLAYRLAHAVQPSVSLLLDLAAQRCQGFRRQQPGNH